MTRNYWWRRAQMGLPEPEFESLPEFANQRQPTDNQPVTLPQSAFQQQGMSEQNPGDLTGGQPGYGRLPSSERAQAELEEAPHWQPKRLLVRARQLHFLRSGLKVQLPAPEIDWDYAVIERLDPMIP